MTKYRRTMDLILRIIDEEGLAPGDRLPAEPELARLARVSIITVRRAMGELEARGVLTRQQGRGTYLARGRMLSRVTQPGPLRAGIGDGRHTLSSRVIRFEQVDCPARPARFLDIPLDAPCWKILRLRAADDGPLLIDLALVPIALAPLLRRSDVDGPASLYETLETRYGLVDIRDEQVLSVVTPLDDERDLLALGDDARLVAVEGASYSAGNEPFAYFRLLFDADRFAFRIDGEQALVVPMPREPDVVAAQAAF